MKILTVNHALAGTIISVACVLGSPSAHAVTSQVLEATTASGFCQPATFTVSQVRQRPEGTRNESSNALYMTCGATGGYNGNASGSATVFYLSVTNTTASAKTVNCTFTDGLKISGTTAFPQSTSVAAGASIYFTWDSAVLNGGTKWEAGSFSCLLQPQVEINTVYMARNQEVGL